MTTTSLTKYYDINHYEPCNMQQVIYFSLLLHLQALQI